MNSDAEHLKLLSIFHYVAGGLCAFFACFPIIHLVLGILFITRPDLLNGGKHPPPAIFGWFFVIFASAAMLFGWTVAVLLLIGGRCLSRRVRYTFCFVVAAVACLFVPLGTVLGVFTIIVLARPSVKALFERPVREGTSVQPPWSPPGYSQDVRET